MRYRQPDIFLARSIENLKLRLQKFLNLVLVLRSKWQSRFKLPSDNWHGASTGTTKLTDAKSTGIEIQQQVLTQLGAGESVPKKTFGEVAQEEIAAMRGTLATSKAKPSLAITGPFYIMGFCLAASSYWTVRWS